MNIICENLNKFYNKKQVLKDVTLNINSTQITSIVGSNGAGKTTLLRCISSLTCINQGEIIMNNEDFVYYYSKKQDLKIIRSYISALLGGNDILYNNLTIIENIRFFLALKKITFDSIKLEYYLNLFDISKYRNSLVSSLSKGSRQKILLILNFLSNCKVLVFDEPTIGLDVTSINKFKLELKKIRENKIIIISSHDLNLVSDISDKVLFIDDGNITNTIFKNDEKFNLYIKKFFKEAE